MSIKVLFISYYFPPQGGAGVQRSLKFVKNLPSFDISPVVVTGPGDGGRWTPKDNTLMSELPDSVVVHRADWPPYKDRLSFLKSIKGHAFLEKLEKWSVDCSLILVTMSPFVDAFIAQELSKRLEVPWIADLRDPWALDEFQVYRSGFHRRSQRNLMQTALSSASCVIMNTPEAVKKYQNSFVSETGQSVECVTNGYDYEDFSAEESRCLDTSYFNIVHTGTFHTDLGLRARKQKCINFLLKRSHPNINYLSRSPYYLLEVLSSIASEFPEISEKIKLVCVGLASDADKKLVLEKSRLEQVRFTGYVSHKESVSYLKQADLLFFPMHGLPAGERASIVPGKLYEYLASGRPVLAAVPEGDARDFSNRAGDCFICRPDSVAELRVAILGCYDRWSKNETKNSLRDFTYVSRFERARLSEKLSEIITEHAQVKG